MNTIADRNYIAIDFEYANNTNGSICAYGLAFPDGTKEHGFIQLHPDNPIQDRTRFHAITQEQTDSGSPFEELYLRISLLSMAENTIFIAHDLKSDRRAWHAACLKHGLKVPSLNWIDSLPIARAELKIGKNKPGTGIASMAARYGIEIQHHNPADDALISMEIIKRNPTPKNIIRD